MLGIGIAEYVIVLLIGSGGGLPLGVPPAPADPVLVSIAPEECLYYMTSAGVGDPQAESENRAEKLLAEPELRAFAKYATDELTQTMRRAALDSGDQTAAFYSEFGPVLARVLLTRPLAMYVSRLELHEDGGSIEGAAIIKPGELTADVRRALNRLSQALPGRTRAVTIANTKFQHFQASPDAPAVTWGFYRDYVVVGVGDNALESLLERIGGEPPKWYRDAVERLPIERRSTFTYADLEGIVAAIRPLTSEPGPASVVQALGLDQLRTYVSVSGLDGEDWVSRTVVDVAGEFDGLLALADQKPLTEDDLAPIPANAMFAVAGRLDTTRAVRTLQEFVETTGTTAARDVDQAQQILERSLGIRLETDILDPLGDVWTLHTSPQTGGLITGWTATLSLDDPGHARRTHDQISNILRGMMLQNARAPQIRSVDFHNNTIYTLAVPESGFPLAPSWCMTDRHLVFGLFPQGVKAHLARGEDAQSLASIRMVAESFAADGDPILVAYQDAQTLFNVLYPMFQVGVQLAAAELQREGIAIDTARLPSQASIAQHLRPFVSSVRRTDRGLMFESRRTIPGGTIDTMAPLIIAAVVPAVQSGRAAAKRMEASNNLKQILLAMHNYHDTFKAFPAAYSVDQQGKPLLSWRVHILPYIEQQALYEQFRLDEPWDSEHNRKLIPQMPKLYRSPASNADPGKSNYLGNAAAESGIFAPPEKESERFPISVGMRDITDGTSNTIAVVEVRDELAVIWTKPDDLQTAKGVLPKDIAGLHEGGFLIGRCDGSVTFVPESIDPNILQALFTRNGGENVPNF